MSIECNGETGCVVIVGTPKTAADEFSALLAKVKLKPVTTEYTGESPAGVFLSEDVCSYK